MLMTVFHVPDSLIALLYSVKHQFYLLMPIAHMFIADLLLLMDIGV